MCIPPVEGSGSLVLVTMTQAQRWGEKVGRLRSTMGPGMIGCSDGLGSRGRVSSNMP